VDGDLALGQSARVEGRRAILIEEKRVRDGRRETAWLTSAPNCVPVGSS
jgi:hypothetical protein